MKVSVLIENYYKNHDRKLKCEHGLSLHITDNNLNVLFDTGDSDAIFHNANKMKIDLEAVDIAILSHAHSDHANGLLTFLKTNEKAKLYMSKNATKKYYETFKADMEVDPNENIGVIREVFENHMDRIIFIKEVTKISPGLYLVPNSSDRKYPLGQSAKLLFMEGEGNIIQDDFLHEISLVRKENDTLDIITGCSHNGISNMVDNIVKHFPNTTINSVTGGFHLMGVPFKDRLGETPEYIENLGKQMLSFNIGKIYTAHCTGKKAFKILQQTLGENITYIHTGNVIEL